MEKFKFDFSKPEEQAEFEKLPKWDKDAQIEVAQNQADGLRQAVGNGEAKDYQEAFEKIEKEKKEFISNLRSTIHEFLKTVIIRGCAMDNNSEKSNLKISELDAVWPKNIDEEIGHEKRSNKGYGDFWNRIEKIEQLVESDPHLLEHANTATVEIPTDRLRAQLDLRYQLLTIFREISTSTYGSAACGGDFEKFLDIYLGQERAIQLGAHLLAPDSTTNNFLKIFNLGDISEQLQEKIEESKGVSKEDRYKKWMEMQGITGQQHADFIAGFFKNYGGWEGRRVLEFGGNETAEFVAKIGAINEVIDAGNSGYQSLRYRVSDVKKIINLETYQSKSMIGGVDMICSANTLDWESGIELMADRPNWTRGDHMATKSCLMAMDELALIFYSQLKQGGFMIHDEMGLPADLCELIGIEEVASFTYSSGLNDDPKEISSGTWGNERVHFYKKTGKPKINKLVIGNKIAAYDKETDAWIQVGTRNNMRQKGKESDLVNLSVDEFILCAKRDLEYSVDGANESAFNWRTGERLGGELYLPGDGFRVNCQLVDIDKLLSVLKPDELAWSLSLESRKDVAIWQKIFDKCKNKRDKQAMLRYAPEEIKKELIITENEI